jgi:hypothetical protein
LFQLIAAFQDEYLDVGGHRRAASAVWPAHEQTRCLAGLWMAIVSLTITQLAPAVKADQRSVGLERIGLPYTALYAAAVNQGQQAGTWVRALLFFGDGGPVR